MWPWQRKWEWCRGSWPSRMAPRGGSSKGHARSSDQFVNEAPTFRPSAEEAADLVAYISSIRLEAEKFGLCKIVLPFDTAPLEWGSLGNSTSNGPTFKASLQLVNELQEKEFGGEGFWESYEAWLQSSQTTWRGNPMLVGRECNLYDLQRSVRRIGGLQKVTEDRSWKDVCRILPVRKSSFRPTRPTSSYTFLTIRKPYSSLISCRSAAFVPLMSSWPSQFLESCKCQNLAPNISRISCTSRIRGLWGERCHSEPCCAVLASVHSLSLSDI